MCDRNVPAKVKVPLNYGHFRHFEVCFVGTIPVVVCSITSSLNLEGITNTENDDCLATFLHAMKSAYHASCSNRVLMIFVLDIS
jgi:hypothetical protein